MTKLWAEDTLTLQFPITLRTEAIKGMKSMKKHKFKCLNSGLEAEMELSFQMTGRSTRPSKRCCSGRISSPA